MISFKDKIFSNSMWMILEKFIGAFGIIFINAYMAKYIGSENFGKLAFTTSIFLFVQTFAWFGSQNIIFKILSQNEEKGINLSINTQNFRRLVFFLISIIALVYLWFYTDKITFVFGVANCIASYFLVLDFYSIFNNTKLESSINALTNLVGLFLGFTIRYFLVYFEASIYLMAIPIILITMIPYLIRKKIFNKNNFKLNNKKSKKYNNYIFKAGGALLLSTLSISIYMQISNFILAKTNSFSDLGIYNVALILGSSWGFINTALIVSFFSKIYSAESLSEEIYYLSLIHWLVIGLGGVVFFSSLIFSKIFILYFFGNDFLKSTEIIPIVVIGAVFSALSTITYRHMIKLNAYRYLSIKMVILSIFSIPMSFFLISSYGVKGAAICFVLVELLSFTFSNYFFKKGLIFKYQLAIFFPIKSIRSKIKLDLK